MNDLIFDCYSIFWQILLNFFPDGEPITADFKLTAFIFSCLMCIIILWFVLRMLYVLTNSVITMISAKKG